MTVWRTAALRLPGVSQDTSHKRGDTTTQLTTVTRSVPQHL